MKTKRDSLRLLAVMALVIALAPHCARAGDLTVQGNLNVSSNLTAGESAELSDGTKLETGGVLYSQGFAWSFENDHWDFGGIVTGFIGSDPTVSQNWLVQAVYSSAPGDNGVVLTAKAFSSEESSAEGDVTFKANDEEALRLSAADLSATFAGKIDATGGIDPPYLLLDAETRASIVRRVTREVPVAKGGGAALFWNNQTKQLEIYVAAEGAFYNLAGNLITNVTPPALTTRDVVSYRIDADSGGIVTNYSRRAPRWQVKQGYRFDRVDGTFQTVTQSNALELITRTNRLGRLQSFIRTNNVNIVRPAGKAEALELR